MAIKSARERIIDAIVQRLTEIDGRPPFETALGASRVYVGEVPALGPDDPAEVLVVIPDDDTIEHQRMNFQIDWSIVIGAVVRADIDQPWVSIERAIADIKRAIELADRQLGLPADVNHPMKRGSTRVFERPEGSYVVGAGVTYVVPYVESWGAP